MMASLSDYMKQYDHEHTHPINKLLHGTGIPLIFTGCILLLLRWQWGLALFLLGWLLLFLGHRIEGNKPAFFQSPVYFLAGPIWVAKEFWEKVCGRARTTPRRTA
jgi:uncharacterized membrane protein YGL010W